MVTEEIHLNTYLESIGVESVETDCFYFASVYKREVHDLQTATYEEWNLI